MRNYRFSFKDDEGNNNRISDQELFTGMVLPRWYMEIGVLVRAELELSYGLRDVGKGSAGYCHLENRERRG